MTDYSEWNDILPSEECTRCKNPIRIYVENVLSKAKPNPHKSKITFTLGDPAVYPEFQVCQSVTQLISQDIEKSLALQSPEGPLASREYLAKVYSTDFWKLTSDDIFLTMGGSSGMWFLLNVLANPGDSILVPHPGFPLIFALAENRDINLITYELENGKDGHVDLADLEEKLKTHKPKLLLLNNPSNPLGTVWSEDHIRSILHLADVYKVPVVADEMYETLVFDPTKAQSIGKLSRGQPVFVFSGLSKLCFVPGWRCGWIACYGNQEIIGGVKEGLRRLCQMYQHPNSVSALKIPQVFEASKKFATEKMVLVEKKAQSIEQKLKGIKGISLYNTKGAFYLSIFIDFKMFKGIDNSQSFALKLLEEENVNVLPGSLFFKDDMIRLVILCSDDDIDEFSMRFKEFCARHMVEEKESDN